MPEGIPPSADRVELVAEDRALRVTALLGEGVPQPTGGVGGWEGVPIPGHRPLTVWRGTPDKTLALPLVFDGYAEGRSVEPQLDVLGRMAGDEPGDPEPPVVTVNGRVPGSGERWVIAGLEWGDALRDRDGARVRASVTVNLLRFTEDERLQRRRLPAKPPSYKFVRAGRGDTYAKIAARKPPHGLGAKRLAARLARLNGKGAGAVHRELKPGTKVKIPVGANLRAWLGKGAR